MPSRWTRPLSLLVLLLILLAFLYLTYHVQDILQTWHVLLAIGTALVLWIGKLVTGRLFGAFIDDRNVVSLSRVQMLSWSALVLSAFLAAVLWNSHLGSSQPIDLIRMDGRLWMLLGISTTSLVASPLILHAKKGLNPDAGDFQRTLEMLPAAEGAANQGLLFANRTIGQATWKDLFTGEETGNAGHLDLSRVQMLFFTLVSLIVYWVSLRSAFLHAQEAKTLMGAFPEVSEGLLWLIGISHGGYLAMKAIPKSRTGDSAAPTPATVDDSSDSSDSSNDQPPVG